VTDQVRYKPDRRGTAQLMRTSEMEGAMMLSCFDAIPFAKAISPDAPPYGEGYIAEFRVEGGRARLAGATRATGRLVNDSDHATAVELGQFGDVSRADTGHHVLARALDVIEHGE